MSKTGKNIFKANFKLNAFPVHTVVAKEWVCSKSHKHDSAFLSSEQVRQIVGLCCACCLRINPRAHTRLPAAPNRNEVLWAWRKSLCFPYKGNTTNASWHGDLPTRAAVSDQFSLKINAFYTFFFRDCWKSDKQIIWTPFVELLILRINIFIATNRIKQLV